MSAQNISKKVHANSPLHRRIISQIQTKRSGVGVEAVWSTQTPTPCSLPRLRATPTPTPAPTPHPWFLWPCAGPSPGLPRSVLALPWSVLTLTSSHCADRRPCLYPFHLWHCLVIDRCTSTCPGLSMLVREEWQVIQTETSFSQNQFRMSHEKEIKMPAWSR